MFQFMIDKYIKKYTDKLYAYTLSQVLDNLIELYSNTWDKDRVKSCIRLIIGINLNAYRNDTKRRKEIQKILKDKFACR